MFPGADKYIIGFDPADPRGDYSATTVMVRPGAIRRFLRKIRLDRSTWESKIVSIEYERRKND